MPIDDNTGVWMPKLSPKQQEVFNSNKRYILVSGPRICGKTRAALHRVVRHCWEVKMGRLAIFVKFKKTAISGVWPLLTDVVMKEWIDSGLESPHGARFGYTVRPKEMGSVRMHYFKMRNYWGGESEVQLHSLDYDKDVEDKVLSAEYSGFYFVELQNFEDPAVFKTVIMNLRMNDVKYEEYMWLADTNPPKTSTEHFAYPIWFVERVMKDHPDKRFQDNLALFLFKLDDAIFADPKMIEDLKALYRFDQEGWDRFVEGKWTRTEGHGDKHFSLLFNKERHVIGDVSDPDEANWELLNPSKETSELLAGWDLGKVNHAMVIVQKRVVETGETTVTHWDVLDELVSVGEKVTVSEFTEIAVDKVEKLEKLIGHEVVWRHWTDTSAYNWDGGGIDDYDYLTVENVSVGKIRFIPAFRAKQKHTVRKRVERFKSLLGECRIHVSAHCVNVIEMFQNLKKGKKELHFIAPGQPYKHTFDALSYVIYSEMFEDLEEDTSGDAVVGPRLITLGG